VYKACGHTGANALYARKQLRARLGQTAFAASTVIALAVLIAVRLLPGGGNP
jgi:hypothetical protein